MARPVVRRKVTLTVDRQKLERAQHLVNARSMSEAIDAALDRLIGHEELRRDVAAYRAYPPTEEELAIGDLPVKLNLDDDDVDYDALYGEGS